MIDLHMHSRFSDGTHTPEELIQLAVEGSLTAVALTDHDTVSGVDEFLRAGQAAGLRVLSGVEVSTSYGPGELHVLGYGIQHKDHTLARQLEWIRSARQVRNEDIYRKLCKLAVPLSWKEIKACAGGDVIGRPHFAQALVARGYALDSKDAFDKYLARGRPAYAKRRSLSAEDAFEIISGAGGVPVLAHPFTLGLKRGELRDLVGDLVDLGLQGIEVYYSQHTPSRQKEYLKLATEFNLVATGGSDFHGARTPDLKLGRGFGALAVPDSVVDRLMERMR